MNKRQYDTSETEHIQKKIRKLEKKIQKQKDKLNNEMNTSPEPQPGPSQPGSSQPVSSQPGSSQTEQANNADQETPTEEVLPEEFLLALGEEGKIDEQKGQNIRQEIADRWTNIIKSGMKKENLQDLLDKYPIPANFPMATAPKLNSEIVTAVSENVVKRDKKFQYRQNLTGKVLSCLGGSLSEIMKGNINSTKLIEGINDAAKILCKMNYNDSITRRYFILNAVQTYVKQAVTDAPIDSYLFGENFSDRLKTAKAVERSGSLIKQPQNKRPEKQPIIRKNLNWKSPPLRRTPKENPRGGPKNQKQAKKPYRQPQQQWRTQRW